jgi:small subunit ribosomal protein S5
MAEVLDESQALESTTVAINRTATTVKGGRRMSFSALVVVGDRNGRVGVGYGKGRGVPAAIEKAQKAAKKNIFKITSRGGTLPHQVTGKFGASTVRLIPAAPGTGVIAGGTVRAVLEMAGVQDVLTKSFGSTNAINLTKAVVDGLKALRSRESVAALRGVEIDSSTVDEMLDASKKLMEETKEVAPAKSLKEANDSIKPKEEPKAEEPKEETKAEAATATEEAPAEEAAEDKPAEAAAETPAEEPPAEADKTEEEKKD